MSLFQHSVLNKYLQGIEEKIVNEGWEKFTAYFHNLERQENIRNSKEEEYGGDFLTELFVNVLGYIKNPNPNFNLKAEQKNLTDSKKADGAILQDEKVIGVIELKGMDTTDLGGKVEVQAFGYKNHQPEAVYVITSNFEKLRFYIDNAVDFEEFNLFQLTQERFKILWLCLAKENVFMGIPKKIKDESLEEEELITKKLYRDYSTFKHEIFNSIVELNPQYDELILFKKTQKLLDRFLFIFFAEDRLLLPPNSISEIIKQWTELKDKYDEYRPLYDRFKKYFEYMNTGYKGKEHTVFAYNGGLFKSDNILDEIKIDDEVLHKYSLKLSHYDFESEVSVNILGHIFEHSLNELEEMTAELEGQIVDKSKSKRKKDGIYYTPKYITKYIVENTVGKLCEEKKTELGFVEEDYEKERKGRRKTTIKKLLGKLEKYRNWLLELTICDPACGSGAFLIQALDFLINEHRYIDELHSKLLGDSIIYRNVETSILENNLYGVDINDEAVEIAKLSLWLRTAHKGRKLTTLSNNIKCGNSLIDDIEIAGEKAFKWKSEFSEIFNKGGFDIVIGNPPYGATLNQLQIDFFRSTYTTVIGHSEVYYLFTEKCLTQLLKRNGVLGFIIPNAWLSNKYARELRKLLIDHTQINILINFNRKIIFKDANVETSILILNNRIPEKGQKAFVGQDITGLYTYEQNEWKNNQYYLMSFAPNRQIDIIIKKINNSEYCLTDKLDISNGFKPYQTGYGLNLKGIPLTRDDVNSKIYHSSSYCDDSYKKEIKGKGVHRYSLKWEESYIKWGSWLMSPKSAHYFEQPKILIRQIISDYFFAVIDNNNYYADQSLYVCTNYPDKSPECLEFYLALMNSKLYGFYFRKFYSEEDDLFPKIKVNELKRLPIKETTKEVQNKFTEKVSLILELHKELQNVNKNFIGRLCDNFNIEKVSKKLDAFYLYDFSSVIVELKKQKITFKLKEQDEWSSYFEEYKDKINLLQAEIDKTDREIDLMVYKLYGLTEREIMIVEGK